MALLKQPYELTADNMKLKILIYGQPGIGKSTTALSMPNPVLIDADNGVHRIAPEHRVPVLQVASYQEVLDVLASGELASFDTIVIDTAGKLLDYMGAWIIKDDPKMARRDGALTMQGYGVRKMQFINLLKTVSTMGKHLVFVAHEKEEKNGDERIIRPEIGGSSGGDLIKELDLVGYMEAMARNRTISFSPCDKYYAKNSARIDDVIQIPGLAGGMPNDFLSGIVRRCDEAARTESARVKEYNTLISHIEHIAEQIADESTANAAVWQIGKLSHFWDSKHRANVIIMTAAKACGLEYSKQKKGFVAAAAVVPSEEEERDVA